MKKYIIPQCDVQNITEGYGLMDLPLSAHPDEETEIVGAKKQIFDWGNEDEVPATPDWDDAPELP